MKTAPIKETVAFEDFEKLDIRAGTITAVEEVAASNKLMKLTVDFGRPHPVDPGRESSKSGQIRRKSKASKPSLW